MKSRRMYVNELLEKALLPKEFKKRGDAFFRVIGDGILQVIKFEYERNYDCGEFFLQFGLFSMYDELRKDWFTSSGCIPRYTATLFTNLRYPSIREYDENGYIIDTFIPYEQQLEILMEKGIPWLDGILTQKQLVDGLCWLDITDRNKIHWLDREKIIPFLKSGQKDNAIRIISSILQQNSLLKWWELPVWKDSDIKRYEEEFPGENEKLLKLYYLITQNDQNALETYYKENYERNWKYASFCKRKEM